MLYYSKTHEWLKIQSGDVYRVGISEYAVEKLGDVTLVDSEELSVNETFKPDDMLLSIESVKSVGEIYAPVAGTVLRVNPTLEDAPELVNASPLEDGWILEISVVDTSEITQKLMNETQYKAYLDTLD